MGIACASTGVRRVGDAKVKTRRGFLIALLGGAAAAMLVGAPQEAAAQEHERRRREVVGFKKEKPACAQPASRLLILIC